LALATLCQDCSGSRSGNQVTEVVRATHDAEAEAEADGSPTNDRSFQLLFRDDQTRFAIIEAYFEQSGKQCSAVTEMTFNGGFDGTDEWLVNCTDTGKWQVWFGPEGRIDFDRCEAVQCA
jgi:hypothetical protein